jgi:membrane protein
MGIDTWIGRYVPAHVQGTTAAVRVGAVAVNRNLTNLAAWLAFSTFVSLIPLILLAVAVASFVGGDTLAGRVTGMLSEQLSSAGQDGVTQALTKTTNRGTVTVVGFLGLAWSALKLFRGLDQAFDELYSGGVESSLPGQIRKGVVVVGGIALATGLVVAVGVAHSFLSVDLPLVDVFLSVCPVAVLRQHRRPTRRRGQRSPL